jgi:hypothetical protein
MPEMYAQYIQKASLFELSSYCTCFTYKCDVFAINKTFSLSFLKQELICAQFLIFRQPKHNVMECGHLEDVGLYGRRILEWILKEVDAWTGLIWLKTGTSGGLFCVRQWTFCFYENLGISCLSEELGYTRRTLLHGVRSWHTAMYRLSETSFNFVTDIRLGYMTICWWVPLGYMTICWWVPLGYMTICWWVPFYNTCTSAAVCRQYACSYSVCINLRNMANFMCLNTPSAKYWF